ncbi:MAG: hypothetical protein ACI352_03985 [Elusimicrobiaceae bacterium]
MSKKKTVRKVFLSKILFVITLLVFVCAGGLFAAVASCSGVTDSGTRYGTISGTCWAYHCATGSITQLGSVDSSYCASCSGVKYAPSGSCGTCEYKCCSDGSWSGCNQECPDPSDCASGTCWNGSSCVSTPTGTKYWGKSDVFYNGTCYYTCNSWVCNKGSGWSCTGKTPVSTQGGTWSDSGSLPVDSYNSISTCSSRVDTSESASVSCSRQGASVRGIPYDIMSENGIIHEAECVAVSSCYCANNTIKTFSNPSQWYSYCGTRAYCSGKKLTCTKQTKSC